MLHHHFKEISSTQEYLKNECENNSFGQEILVSCEDQTAGMGQYDRKWDSFKETLCFSILLKQNKVPTLTSLEMACLIHKYFNEKYQIPLALKWPNDILTLKGEKVAGLILNNFKDSMVVGIGINYFKNEIQKNYQTKYGYLFKELFTLDKKKESFSIAKFLLQQRIQPEEVRNYWASNCLHLNKSIIFHEGTNENQGNFCGIGLNGEAIIENKNGEKKSFYSGTISIRI